jgi:predicted cupin superfamily sugar epimerase
MSTPSNAAYWQEHLQLQPHVEGGFFRETYRSAAMSGNRNASTGIFFLLENHVFSAFHRIASDEMWHFYDGNPLNIYEITPDGHLTVHKLGLNMHLGECPQLVIKAGSWFASRVAGEAGFTLVGCTVAPGFDFADFEMGDRAALLAAYPAHAELIQQLTRA